MGPGRNGLESSHSRGEGVLVEGNGDKGESTRASEHEAGDLNVRRTILKKGALQRPR
jgi:hypothetical protein